MTDDHGVRRFDSLPPRGAARRRRMHLAVTALLVAGAGCTIREKADAATDGERAAPPPAPAAASDLRSVAEVFVTDTAGLDSCARLDAESRAQARVSNPGDTLPSLSAGSWADAKRVMLDSFSIQIPALARARTHDGNRMYVIDSLPGCRYFCALEISFSYDSAGEGLDAYVDALRAVDSTDDEDAADWIPGPPSPVRVDGEAAVKMETPCGDCTSGEILAMRARRIATIAWNIDDREGYQPGLACRLERVARTFKWGS